MSEIKQEICKMLNPMGEVILDIEAELEKGHFVICSICIKEFPKYCQHLPGQTYSIKVRESRTVKPRTVWSPRFAGAKE